METTECRSICTGVSYTHMYISIYTYICTYAFGWHDLLEDHQIDHKTAASAEVSVIVLKRG